LQPEENRIPMASSKPHLDSVFDQGQRSRRRITDRWSIRLLLIFLLVGGGLAAYCSRLIPSPLEADRMLQTVPVERRNLTITISANGTVEPEQSTNVSPKSAGRLEQILVAEGDAVTQGQILAYMDDSGLQGQLAEAEGQLASDYANLKKVKIGNRPEEIAQTQARLSSAEASLRQAEDDLRRNEQLYAEGAISAQEVNTARSTRDSSQAAVEEAQQALSLSEAGSRPEEIDQAMAAVIRSQGARQTIQSQIEDTVIRAPFSGVVIHRYADPGDFVTPTTAVSADSSATSASILQLGSRYQVVASVAESTISQIQVGQPVTIAADAYRDRTFSGQVMRIAEGATVETNVTSFDVRIALLSDTDRHLRSGMNVTVDFQVGERNQALVVPTVAIVRQPDRTGVLVLRPDSQPAFQLIQTGATVDNHTEVTAGLTGDEQILINVPLESSAPSRSRSLFLPGRLQPDQPDPAVVPTPAQPSPTE
jgi:HlyD family secretion protein